MIKLLLLTIMCLPFTVFSQDPQFARNTELYKIEAQKLTRAYDKELGLTKIQKPLFQKKVLEILIRNAQLTSTKIGEPLPGMLHTLKKEEANAMRTILTIRQYKLYILLRDQLQPSAKAIVEQ